MVVFVVAENVNFTRFNLTSYDSEKSMFINIGYGCIIQRL